MDIEMTSSDVSDYDDSDISNNEAKDDLSLQDKKTVCIYNSVEEAEHYLLSVNEPSKISSKSDIYICDSVKEANQCLHNYEIDNTVRFAAFSTPKDFGSTDIFSHKHKVLWETSPEFFNTPYVVLSSKRFDCHHGVDRNSNAKQKYIDAKENQKKFDHWYRGEYVIIQDTKKFECPAKVNIKEIVYFTSLKSELLSQKIDHRLSTKISEFVKQGVSNVCEMKRLLKIMVSDMFGKKDLPPSNNRRFYPRNNIIRTHIVIERQKLRFSNIDQDCLENKINEWKVSDATVKIHYHPKRSHSKDELLFVYQAGWQKKLLNKYGNEMVFLDATYKTTRYSLPLFFLVVKTNVDFQIVATFVSESETFDTIKKALNVIKSWNLDFQPLYCMTDYCNEEIRALESVFFGCEVFICDFHREQAWDRWIKKTSNGCFSKKEDILKLLRCIAWSRSCEEEVDAIKALELSDFWCQDGFSKLKHYVEMYWMPIKKRWIWWYRQNRLLINCNTNNGVERQNESFKYCYLKKYNNSSLTGMLTLLIEEFFTDKLESYTDANFKMDARYRRYGCWVPKYLYNRPRSLVKHCLLRKSTADYMDLNTVVMMKHGIFTVSSTIDSSTKYFVHFGDENIMPKCTCYDWISTGYPCKHFFAIFKKYPAWSWNTLSKLYVNSPFLNLDEDNYDIFHEKKPFNFSKLLSPLKESSLSLKKNTTVEDQNDICKKHIPIYSGVDVREMLNTIKNLSFEFEANSDELVMLHKTLSTLIDKLNKGRVRESGIPVTQTNNKLSKKHISIPVRKPIKAQTKRVGSQKEKTSNASKVFIVAESYLVDSIEHKIVDEPVNKERFVVDHEIVISHNNDEHLVEKLVLLPQTKLSSDDMNDITTHQMLSDNVIHSVQKMITGVSGLQDPVLGQNLSFCVVKGSFVQVLHDGDVHWLTISTFGCSEGEVFLLDSMFKGKIKNYVVRQICAIMQCTKDSLKVRVLPVQQQTNGVDCGLFALAFAQHIACTGSNPHYISFENDEMRNHLFKSVIENHLNEFPKTGKLTRFCKEKEFNFTLYCVCRQIWMASDKVVKDNCVCHCFISLPTVETWF
ncbi:uncharacterized protein LOC136082459 isoform X2 [Hydra vulgaris]|uniref:Uncharacterized protein LOC136082459 isoform X2 n=1 Tax=Hydra vulgaris TaxID=6087 RepID=A0ABM4C8E6_HYDVU